MLALRTPTGRNVGAKSWPLALQGAASYSLPGTGIKQPETFELIGGTATYEEMYRKQVWVHVVVNKLARACARLPLQTYTLSEATGEQEPAPTSPVGKLLRRPFPMARSFQLIEHIVGSLGIYGNATCVKFRGGNGQTPVELWPLPWPQVEVIYGTDRPVEAYRWWGRDGTHKVFLADDVVHFRWWNPNPLHPYGVSPLEALAVTLALENAGQRYAISSFGNAARPASFIMSTRNMTKTQRAELRAEIEESYGGPENAFKVALLDNGLEWKPLGHSMRDTNLVENRKLSREEVCAAYDLPPPMVGILDHATYSNIEQQHWMLYMDSLAPILTMIEQTLMAQLVDPEPAWDGYLTAFDMDGVTRGNIEQRSQAYQRFLYSGVYTPNELRKLEGLKPIDIEEADAVFVPINYDPLSKAVEKKKQAEQQQQMEMQQQQAEVQHQRTLEVAAAGGTVNKPAQQQQQRDQAAKERLDRMMLALVTKSDGDREEWRELIAALKAAEPPVINVAPPEVKFEPGTFTLDAHFHEAVKPNGVKHIEIEHDEEGKPVGATVTE